MTTAEVRLHERSGPGPAEPADRWRRTSSVLAMVIAPWGFVVTNICYLLAIRGGGDDLTNAAALELYGDHPTLVRVGSLAGMIGCLLIVPAVLGVFRLAPRSRLVTIGGSMMIAGYVCYLSVLASGFTALAMAEHGGPVGDFVAVLDTSQEQWWTTWVFLLFVLGNLVGTLLLAIGLLRSRAVPVWAAVAILSWPPLHVFGLVFLPNEVPQVVGAVLQAAGFAGAAVALARQREAR